MWCCCIFIWTKLTKIHTKRTCGPNLLFLQSNFHHRYQKLHICSLYHQTCHTFSSEHWPEPRCHIPGRQWSGSCTPLQSQVAAGFQCSPRGQWNSDYMALWKTVKRRVIPLSQTEYLLLHGLCNPLTIPADFLSDTAHLGLWALGVQRTKTG